MLVNVTQEDIDTARRNQPFLIASESCPIALAVKRVFNTRVIVGRQRVIFPREHTSAGLPHSACEFIGRFDNNKDPVFPFEFSLDLEKQEL